MFSTIDFILAYRWFVELLELLPDGIGNAIFEILKFVLGILFGTVHI